MDDQLLNRLGNDRLASRQIDELIGLARGIVADGHLNQTEVEYLQSWLAANWEVTQEPVISTLFHRVSEVLGDGELDATEAAELLDTLQSLGGGRTELGEVLKSTTLPLCQPAPHLTFDRMNYCFTGTFMFGQRKDCEKAVSDRGAICGSVNKKLNVLVIGTYATESWKHSSVGNKILKAVDLRTKGSPLRIVAEDHWKDFL